MLRRDQSRSSSSVSGSSGRSRTPEDDDVSTSSICLTESSGSSMTSDWESDDTPAGSDGSSESSSSSSEDLATASLTSSPSTTSQPNSREDSISSSDSTTSDFQEDNSAHDTASSASSVRDFVQETLDKGVSGLLREFEFEKETWAQRWRTGKDGKGKFRVFGVYDSWDEVWNEKAQFVLFLGNGKRWIELCDGEVAMQNGYKIRLKIDRSFDDQVDARKYSVKKLGTRNRKRTIKVLRCRDWAAKFPPVDDLVTIIAELSKSARPVLVSNEGDDDDDKRAITFIVAQLAMERLSVHFSMFTEGPGAWLMNRISATQYVYAHLVLLEYCKDEVDDERQMNKFRADFHFLVNEQRVRVFHYNTEIVYLGDNEKDRVLSHGPFHTSPFHTSAPFHTYNCECTLLLDLRMVESPEMEGGLSVVFIYGKVYTKDGALVIECDEEGQKADCSGDNNIPLATIVDFLHRKRDGDILVSFMNCKPAAANGGLDLATSRVAVIMATCVHDRFDDDDSDEEENLNARQKSTGKKELARMEEVDESITRMTILETLGLFVSPREAVVSLNGKRCGARATLNVRMDENWMQSDLCRSSSSDSSDESLVEANPTASEFRRLLLHSKQSIDSEMRLNAERHLRRIPGEVKRDMLLELFRTESDDEIRSLALMRLHSVLICTDSFWGDEVIRAIVTDILHVARVERSPKLCAPIAKVLGQLIWYTIKCNDDSEQIIVDQIMQFIMEAAYSDTQIQKCTAINVATSGLIMYKLYTKDHNEWTHFWERIFSDQEARPKAFMRWAHTIVKNYNRGAEFFEQMIDEPTHDSFLESRIHELYAAGEGGKATEEGSPLWTLLKIGCLAPSCLNDICGTIFVDAAKREEDEATQADLIKALSGLINACGYGGDWSDLVALAEHLEMKNNHMATKHFLSIFARTERHRWACEYNYDETQLGILLTSIDNAMQTQELQRVAIAAFVKIVKGTESWRIAALELRLRHTINVIIKLANDRSTAIRSLQELQEIDALPASIKAVIEAQAESNVHDE